MTEDWLVFISAQACTMYAWGLNSGSYLAEL